MAGSCAGRGRRGARPLPPGARLAGPRGAEFPVGRRPRGAEGEEGGAGAALPGRTRGLLLCRAVLWVPGDASPRAEPGTDRVQADTRTSLARRGPGLSFPSRDPGVPTSGGETLHLAPPISGFGIGLMFLQDSASPGVLQRGRVLGVNKSLQLTEQQQSCINTSI